MPPNKQPKPYRVSAEEAESSSRYLQHPLDPDAGRRTFSLGDHCGLSKLGVHHCRVEPHKTSSVIHWHHNEEDFFYILDAGESGATLITLREGTGGPQEEPVKTGDFIGFPAGKGIGYALRAGEKELVYLCGGTRQSMDVCRYPTLGRTLVVDRTGAEGGSHFFVESKDVEKWGL